MAEPPSRDADAALAYALCEATRAGQWAAVVELSRALSSRRMPP